jgi:hypothetical protein
LLPNFLIIGAAKAGTTALHEYLALHPDVAMSRQKELHVFAEPNWRSRLDWYERQFAAGVARGESSPSYSMDPWIAGVPERIHELLPDVKLLYLVRDPVERAVAQWVEFYSLYEEHRPFEEAVAEPEDPANPYLAASRYASQLERYLEHFPQERILVLDQRELLEDRRAALGSVFSFLAVDPDFWTPDFLRSHNVRREKVRLNDVGLWFYRRGWFPHLRSAVPKMRPRLRRATLGIVADRVETPRVEGELRARLEAALRDDAERFRALTGRSFESWSV